jgi:hypothetical protein
LILGFSILYIQSVLCNIFRFKINYTVRRIMSCLRLYKKAKECELLRSRSRVVKTGITLTRECEFSHDAKRAKS